MRTSGNGSRFRHVRPRAGAFRPADSPIAACERSLRLMPSAHAFILLLSGLRGLPAGPGDGLRPAQRAGRRHERQRHGRAGRDVRVGRAQGGLVARRCRRGCRNWADCIVWFPDDFQPPSKKVRHWLEQWLSEAAGRTLIYVGRDFDAAPGTGRRSFPWPRPIRAELVRSRLADARQSFQLPPRASCPSRPIATGSRVRRSDRARKVRTLSGRRGVAGRRRPGEGGNRAGRPHRAGPADADMLLKSEDDVLVSSATDRQRPS